MATATQILRQPHPQQRRKSSTASVSDPESSGLRALLTEPSCSCSHRLPNGDASRSMRFCESQMGANRSGWPKSPRALAGRLRRAQTFLRILGIEVGFGREGRLGTRTIRITAIGEDRSRNTVCTVCSVRGDGARVGTTAAAIGGESATTVSPRFGRPVPAIGLVLSQAADDAADGADANAAFQGGPTDSGSV